MDKIEFSFTEILGLVDTKTEKGKDGRKSLVFTGGVRFRWNETGENFEVLVLDYHRDGTGSLQIKFPGGCSEYGENPRNTLTREMIAETGRPMTRKAQVLHYRPIMQEGKRDLQSIDHIQIFFFEELPFSDKSLFLKTVTGSDNGECGPVRWEAITQELLDGMFPSHQVALKKLIRKLQNGSSGGDMKKILSVTSIRV